MPINEEYIFTYDDYLEIIQPKGLICVAENDVEYKIDKMEKEVHQKHDKSFKEVLSNKDEMAFFLREFVGIEVRETELQQYKSEFITNGYEKREADVIYKNAEKEIYYIVEHQSRKDRNMPFRIAEYCMELMKEVVKNSNSKFYPIIVPIVLYTGKGKWNVDTNFAERQKTYEGTYEEYKVNIKYTVVDINKIKNIKLLEKQDYLANIMLMEKCKTNEARAEMFKKIYNEMNSEKQKEKILNYIISIYEQTLESEEIKRFYKILERSGENMTAMYQYIIQERKENIKKGRAEERRKVAKNLLKLKMPIQQITKATGLSEKEIGKLSENLT